MNHDRDDAPHPGRRPPRLARSHDIDIESGEAGSHGNSSQLTLNPGPHGNQLRRIARRSANATTIRAETPPQVLTESDAVRAGPTPPDGRTRRANVTRDGCAVVLLLAATVLPWNLYFGVGIPESRGTLFAVVMVATGLSLASIVVTRIGHHRLRLLLNIPYLLLVAVFVVFAVVQMIRYGGTAVASPGVGPGAWAGIAGSLLAAQPTFTGQERDVDRFAAWLQSARIIGIASLVVAALSAGFTLYWRTRHALPAASDTAPGGHRAAIIATAVVYGAAALAPLIIGGSWLLRRTRGARLATTAVAGCSLGAGITVWCSGIGREIDAFHGIAQSTSISGVGFEGYLAWLAGAAIVAPVTLYSTLGADTKTAAAWRQAAHKVLLLIAIWCLASVVMRATDLIDAVSLGLNYRPADSAGLIAVDLATGVLALWLRGRLAADAPASLRVLEWLGLLVLTVSRVVVGIVLAPRKAGAAAALAQDNPVYGNAAAQQITSTFDVVLCGLALMALVSAAYTARTVGRLGTDQPASATEGSGREPRPDAAAGPGPAPAESSPMGAASAGTPSASPPVARSRAPRLFREPETSTPRDTIAGRADAPDVVDVSEDPASHDDIVLPSARRTLKSADTPRAERPTAHEERVDDTDNPSPPQLSSTDASERRCAPQGPAGRVLHDSAQRFHAGLTYSGPRTDSSPEPSTREPKIACGPHVSPTAAGRSGKDEEAGKGAHTTSSGPSDPAVPDSATDDGTGSPDVPATPPRPLADSAQRFPAGLTYGGPHPQTTLNPSDPESKNAGL